MTERLGSGLQSRVRGFDSRQRLVSECDCDGQCSFCAEHGHDACANKLMSDQNTLAAAVISRQLIDDGHGDIQHCIAEAFILATELKPIVRRAVCALFEGLESSPYDIADELDKEVRSSKKEDGVYISDFTRGIEYAAGVVRAIGDRAAGQQEEEAK